MDKVFIEGLQISTIVGIHEWEREHRQPVVLDLEMAWDNRPAASSDAIDDALDYHAVSSRLRAFVGHSDFQLIETLAERCAALVMNEFGVSQLRLTVRKPEAVPEAASVGVIIERRKGAGAE